MLSFSRRLADVGLEMYCVMVVNCGSCERHVSVEVEVGVLWCV